MKGAAAFDDLRNVDRDDFDAVFLQQSLRPRIALRHHYKARFDSYEIAAESFADFSSRRDFEYFESFFFSISTIS